MSPTTKEQLHRLIDELAESDLHAVRLFLEFVQARSLASRVASFDADGAEDTMLRVLMAAPEDDEETTPEEDASADQAWTAYQRGDSMTAEEARRRLLGDEPVRP